MNQQPLDLHGPLTGLLDRAAQSADANKPFMVVDGKPLTYGAFTDRVARLIALFGAKGLSRGDRAGIVTDDPAMAAALIVAALRAGVAIDRKSVV